MLGSGRTGGRQANQPLRAVQTPDRHAGHGLAPPAGTRDANPDHDTTRRTGRSPLVFVTLVDDVVCRPEHAAQVDNLLFVDVLVLRLVEDLRLAADRDLEPAVVALVDLSDVLQQGQDSVPLATLWLVGC